MSNPQYGKAGYYNQENFSLRELIKYPEIQQHFLTLMSAPVKETTSTTTSGDKETQSFERLIDSLSANLQKHQNSHIELAKAILAIRDQYYKLTQSQKEEFILRNKLLNNELLELEEQLIEAGFISPMDILNPAYLSDPKLKVESAAKILRNILVERNKIPSSFFDFQETPKIETETKKEVSLDSFRNEFTILNFSRCLVALTDLANTQHMVLSKEKPINERWNELLPNLKLQKVYTDSKYLSSPLILLDYEEIDPKEYHLTTNFTEIYHMTLQFLNDALISVSRVISISFKS